MMKRSIFSCFLMATVIVSMVSCSKDHDVFNNSAVEQQHKSEFESNFIKKYGAVDPEQTWDFAKMYPTYSLSGNTILPRNLTRAVIDGGSEYMSIGDWYEVDAKTIEWMKKKLPDGRNHEDLGNPFYMIVPQNEFSIVPIYQGTGDFVWTLHLVVEDFNDQGDRFHKKAHRMSDTL